MGELAALEAVIWVEPYFEPQLFNDVGGGTIMKAGAIRSSLGLYGGEQVVAITDTGLDVGTYGSSMSDDFEGRVLSGKSICGLFGGRSTWNDIHGHGTHVAGSVLGSGVLSGSDPIKHDYDNSYAGVAPEADLVFQSIGDSDGSLCVPTSDLKNYLFSPAYDGGARIHTNSWGGRTGGTQENPEYGGYTSFSQNVDQTVWDYQDFLLLYAAGNFGKDVDQNGLVDADSIASPGTAKNVITVGASENNRPGITTTWGAGFPSDNWVEPIFSDPVADKTNGMAAFSSRGPPDDKRIKPDFVAPGTFIISARSHDPSAGIGWGIVNDDYVYNGGTSMATPLTAGGAVLAREWLTDILGFLNPTAALVKAVLINGTADMSPGQYDSPQEIPAQRPNNITGWGRLDLAASLKPPAPKKICLKDN